MPNNNNLRHNNSDLLRFVKDHSLHCAASGGSVNVVDAVRLLITADAHVSCVDADGNLPFDVIVVPFKLQKLRQFSKNFIWIMVLITDLLSSSLVRCLLMLLVLVRLKIRCRLQMTANKAEKPKPALTLTCFTMSH